MPQDDVSKLMHENAVLPARGLCRVQDHEMSTFNPQSKPRPFLATRTEKVLNVSDRNSGDLVGMPNGHIVVPGNISG
jgi:hypothetical protein